MLIILNNTSNTNKLVNQQLMITVFSESTFHKSEGGITNQGGRSPLIRFFLQNTTQGSQI